MEAKDLAQLKEILTNWLEELLNQGDNTVLRLREVGEDLSDPLDQASFEADRSFTLRIRDRELEIDFHGTAIDHEEQSSPFVTR